MDALKAASVAIQNVQKEGLTDIFDRPFELDLLKDLSFRNRVRENIVKSIGSGGLSGLGVNAIDHVLVPKNSPFSFRRCALMHPMDTLKYFALVLTIADIVEKARIPLRKKRVYSYRFRLKKLDSGEAMRPSPPCTSNYAPPYIWTLLARSHWT